jgi:2-polyprenyl-3-methyl-5-hydroxy-6-metoxy-1,4-benzoquinol methylase
MRAHHPATPCCLRDAQDTARTTQATLGHLYSFRDYYGKGSSQQHSDFKATVAQRVYTTFKLADSASWWLDISCGGGTRQMVAAVCGLRCLGLDLRAACIEECTAIATRLNLSSKANFATGDMRNVRDTVTRFRTALLTKSVTARSDGCGHPNATQPKFGGMFTSIPFW